MSDGSSSNRSSVCFSSGGFVLDFVPASVCIDPTTKTDMWLLLLLPPPLVLLLLLLLLLPGGVFSSGSFRVVLFIWVQDCILDHPSH